MAKINIKINSEMAKKMKYFYMKGESGHMLARKFDIHFSTVYECLRKNGVKIRSTKEAGILASAKGRIYKHPIPESSVIFSPEKSYILGVMCGDGYVHCTKNKSYQISLQAIDKDFVLKFADCLNKVYGLKAQIRKVRVKPHKWSDKWQARVCCKEIFNDILDHGFFKTNSWRTPKIVFESSDEIKCSFLRGFFDSEGSVDINSRRIVAVSTNRYGINDIVRLLNGLDIKSRIHKNVRTSENRITCFSVRITGRQNIIKYNEKIGFSIKRKQAKLDETTKSYTHFMKPHEEVKRLFPQMLELRNKGMSYEKIANKLGIGTATVWVYLNNKHKLRN